MSNVALKLFCLVDIIGSTDHMHNGTGQMAHADRIQQSAVEFKSMLVEYSGSYENFTGDGYLASFADPNKALAFAVTYSRNQNTSHYKIRVALTSGSATYSDEGVVSDAINLAARIICKGTSGNIIISDAAYAILYNLDKNISKCVESVDGEDIRNYGLITYYVYDNQKQQSLAANVAHVKSLFESTGIFPVNILDSDYGENSILIWPVVPRTSLNLIHIGQLSVIKFLCNNFGWKLKILIADLMDDMPSVKHDYTTKMNLYFLNNQMVVDEILYLSELMKEETKTCCQITKGTFNTYLRLITFEQMEKFIGKDYNTSDHKTKSVWKTLRPFFTLAASAYLSSTLDKKCIILAGYDEHDMWNACTMHAMYERNLGAILVPILKKNDNSQFSHEDKAFYWRSAKAINSAIRDSNIAEWTNDLVLRIHNDSETISGPWDKAKTQTISDIILRRLNLQHESAF